jgi:hypothetical protein
LEDLLALVAVGDAKTSLITANLFHFRRNISSDSSSSRSGIHSVVERHILTRALDKLIRARDTQLEQFTLEAANLKAGMLHIDLYN